MSKVHLVILNKVDLFAKFFQKICAGGAIWFNDCVIDTDERLSSLLPTIDSADWLALDTEADSLHAYPEKVCLIQISTSHGDELIDPLAPIDLIPLFAALKSHELIVHAADYDLRLLRKHHNFLVAHIFDTMLAARLLGEAQFGLGALVEKFLGIQLDKGPQKADWARRPLTERMENYARNDTRHLKPLSDNLRAGLTRKGRLAWHEESCARLIFECSQPSPTDENTVWRIKGSSKLSRPALAILLELWAWREKEALGANRPPFFILSHETVVLIAATAALGQPVESLIPPRISPRRREALIKAVQAGLNVPPANHPELIRQKFIRPSEAEFRRFSEIAGRRDRKAKELGIDPTIIASRSTMGDLARDWDKYAPDLMKWQLALLQ
jgi:ribonuclease D